jgi:hypothetical protein
MARLACQTPICSHNNAAIPMIRSNFSSRTVHATVGHNLPRLNHAVRQWRRADAPRDDPSEPTITGRLQASLDDLDLNQLQTALRLAIEAENYALAAKIRDVLAMVLGPEFKSTADWHRLGILDWLADRATDLGYRLPTGTHSICSPICTWNYIVATTRMLINPLALVQRCSGVQHPSFWTMTIVSSSLKREAARPWPSSYPLYQPWRTPLTCIRKTLRGRRL